MQKFASIDFSNHARQRMRERRISEAQVTRTLNAPDTVYPGRRDRLVAERATAGGNIPRVVYVEHVSGTQITSAIVLTAVRMRKTGVST